jgi:hypothetical protein
MLDHVWQNRLNYSGLSALIIAIQTILIQRTSNGTTHWSVRSPPDATTVQQDRSRFTLHEGELYSRITAHQLLIHRIFNIITNRFKLKVINKYCLKRQAKHASQVHSGREINMRLHTSRRLTPHSARYMASFRRVTTSRGRIPLHRPAKRDRSWPCGTIRGVFKGHT